MSMLSKKEKETLCRLKKRIKKVSVYIKKKQCEYLTRSNIANDYFQLYIGESLWTKFENFISEKANGKSFEKQEYFMRRQLHPELKTKINIKEKNKF